MALKDNAPNQQGEEETGEEGGHGEKKKPKKLILIGAAVVLVLALAGGGYFFFMSGGDKDKKEETEEVAEREEAPAEHGEAGEHGEAAEGKEGKAAKGADGKATGVVFYDLPDFVVNLNDKGSKTRFLKLSVTLELPNGEAMEQIDKMRPRIMDSFQVYLRELRKSDLEGSAGLYRLREELLLRVNKTVYPAKVNDILFKELITQ